MLAEEMTQEPKGFSVKPPVKFERGLNALIWICPQMAVILVNAEEIFLFESFRLCIAYKMHKKIYNNYSIPFHTSFNKALNIDVH